MPGGRNVVVRERERLRVPEPTRERLPNELVVPARDVSERRRPGTAIEVLVSAADGEIDVRGIESDVDHSGAVAHIPKREGAGRMRCRGQARHAD